MKCFIHKIKFTRLTTTTRFGGIWVSLYCIRKYHKHIWASTSDFQQCGMCDQHRLRPACAYAQSDQSLCWSHEYSMTVKLLTEHHLEFLNLKGGCTGSTESTFVKIPHCWKSRVAAHITDRRPTYDTKRKMQKKPTHTHTATLV